MTAEPIQCEYRDGRATVKMTYRFPGNKRQTHYRLCADHAARFDTNTAGSYVGSKPIFSPGMFARVQYA